MILDFITIVLAFNRNVFFFSDLLLLVIRLRVSTPKRNRELSHETQTSVLCGIVSAGFCITVVLCGLLTTILVEILSTQQCKLFQLPKYPEIRRYPIFGLSSLVHIFAFFNVQERNNKGSLCGFSDLRCAAVLRYRKKQIFGYDVHRFCSFYSRFFGVPICVGFF